MPRYTFLVDVDIPDPEHDESYEQAVQVMDERLDHDEDYGFAYRVGYRRFKTSNIPPEVQFNAAH